MLAAYAKAKQRERLTRAFMLAWRPFVRALFRGLGYAAALLIFLAIYKVMK